MMPQVKKGGISENDLLMYLALGVKHLRLMVLLICLSLTLGLFYYTFARPVYYSKALVRFQSLGRPLDTQKVFHDSSMRTVVAELQAPHIVERTAKRLGVNATARTIKRKYIKRLNVGPNSEGNIVITVWPYSQDWAEKWAEANVQEYLLWRDERRINVKALTFATYNQDMSDLKKQMDKVINDQFDRRETNQVTRVMAQLNASATTPRLIETIKHALTLMDQTREALENTNYDNVAKLSLLTKWKHDEQFTEARAETHVPDLAIGETIPKEDPDGILLTPPVLSPPTVGVPPLKESWQDLADERQRLVLQQQKEARTYLPGHPRMKEIQKQIDTINKKLNVELEVVLTRFNLEYVSLVDKQHRMEARLPDYDKAIRDYAITIRDNKLFNASQLEWASMYEAMARRLTALDFGSEKERLQLDYLGLLESRDVPVAPNRLKLVVMFLMLGLALAVAIPFLIEYLDSRISDVDQAEETLRLRNLGVVPKVTDFPMEETIFTDLDSKTSHHVQENFRLIRTNLIMNSASPALPQVILVTSAMPLEGKTIVAANLALSFARKGEKTLLIDADLRRGRLHRVFAAQNRPGLSEVLVQNRPIAESCRIVGNGSINGNLTLLPCGKHIHFASEFLDSASFPKMIDELRQKYQRIIIDTPPVLGLSETSIIQRVADGVLMVIWSGWTPMRDVKTAIQTLQTNGAKFAGFVLNRLDFRVLTNRYKYFYYSPYYYASYQATEPPIPPPPQLTATE